MRVSCTSLKQSFRDVGFLAVDVYTTSNRDGLGRTILLLITCSLFSLFLSSFLLLYLLFTLDYEIAVAGGIAGCFGVLLTVALFLSKQIRCTGILFAMSIFMKKSRNLLLAAGTSVVVLKNIRNTLENLTGLIRSMVCNLKAKKASIVISPLENFTRMLMWIGNTLKGLTNLEVIKFDSELNVSTKFEAGLFTEKLADAEQRLNKSAKYAEAIVSTLFSVADRMFPAISFLLLMMFIALHIKKYRSDMKFENTFVTSKFIQFDQKQKEQGKPHVLPLTPEESKLYASVPSARPTTQEGRAMLKFGIRILPHFVAWVIFITVDALLYCFVDIVTRKLSELEPFSIPLGTSIVIGLKLGEQNYQEDFSYSVTLFEKRCLPKPKLLLYSSVVPLAAILIALLIMAMMAAKLTQLRLMVYERFFSASAEERAEYLHAKILRKRLKGRKQRDNVGSPTSFFFKPHFWCPLLFRHKEDLQNSA
uniref:Dendrocyte expressed seven transmembrane protein n=1 Tax=Myripristis murdjan TaxID=586833 RepID=A0A667ZQE0_9TELE